MRHASLQANSMAGGKRALTRQRARGTGAALNPLRQTTLTSSLVASFGPLEDAGPGFSTELAHGCVGPLAGV